MYKLYLLLVFSYLDGVFTKIIKNIIITQKKINTLRLILGKIYISSLVLLFMLKIL
jgi:hypothetical protein